MPWRQFRPFRFRAAGIEPTLLGGDGIADLASVSCFVRGVFVRIKRSARVGNAVEDETYERARKPRVHAAQLRQMTADRAQDRMILAPPAKFTRASRAARFDRADKATDIADRRNRGAV